MKLLKISLLGGVALVLLTNIVTVAAQPRVIVHDLRGEEATTYQYPMNPGSYYAQHYRPRSLPVPVITDKSPVILLEESINKVIDFLATPQQASLEQITDFLNHEIAPHFDFEYMARWVAGRYYKTMNPEQQKQFTRIFKELFITTFVQKLSNFRNYPPVVEDFRSRRINDNEAMASARIVQEGGTVVRVDFKFLRTSRGWKVIDVRANGVSALFYYRNFFAQQIRRQRQNSEVFN